MIVQAILLIGLLLCISYAFLQRKKSSLVSRSMYAVSGLGIFFVLFPEVSTRIANDVGVGRGADLVVYCWIVISLLVSVNLQFKILNLQENVTQITRALALHYPKHPPDKS